MFRNISFLSLIIVLSSPSMAQAPVQIAADSGIASKEGKFTGSPITIKLKDADVHDVLRLIGDTSGFNIVIHPSVSGKLTLSLEQVPWDQALDVVLTTLRLGAERNDSVLRILPKDMLMAEKQQDLDTKRLSMASAPRVTRIFPISYADLSQISTILTNFTNSQNTIGGATGTPTTIISDANTQSLIVRDTVENLEKIKKMIELIDVQTQQVLIEAKVVEAGEDFTKSFGGSFGIGSDGLGFGFNGAAALLGTVIPLAGNNSAVGAGAFQRSSVYNIAGNPIGIQSALNMAEKESKIKVVSSPRTVVLSGKTSSITQSKATALQLTTPATATAPATTNIVQVTANTKLNVTPKVTNDGSVFMKLDMSRDILNLTNTNAPAAEPRTITTEVIVESGNTLVIGGVLNLDETTTEQGMPFLRKIPILGALFGSENTVKTKSELMFFITPRILNQRKVSFSDEEMKKL